MTMHPHDHDHDAHDHDQAATADDHDHGHDEHAHGAAHDHDHDAHDHDQAATADDHDHGHDEHAHGAAHDHDAHDHDGHDHGHAHTFDAASLRNNDALYAEVYAEVVNWLRLPNKAGVLEAGSGAGGFTRLLAAVLHQSGGSVTALDESQDLLDATRELLDKGPDAGVVAYQLGDIAHLPFDDGAFDLVWSSRTVHHVPDQLAAVRELARVVKPGGRLALREGSVRTRFLPDDIGLGAPGLEDRLDVAFQEWFTANVRSGEGSVRYPYGWTQMLTDAGFHDVTAKSFLLEALPPFSDEQISYMGRHIRRWVEDDHRREMLDHDDVHALGELVNPAGAHFVFGRQDLHLRELVTVYVGTR
jgi:ubiquinone/menaquinone biosynthesis C-methylase UbiE